MQRFTHALSALFAIVFMASCASTESQKPTHHWASQESVNAIQYQQDHARCQVAAGMDVTNKTFKPNSAQFSSYQQCMNHSGYTLTASTD